MQKGIEAAPFLIKPNQMSWKIMFKKKFATLNEIVEGAREIIKKRRGKCDGKPQSIRSYGSAAWHTLKKKSGSIL